MVGPVCALDISTKTGWVCGHHGRNTPPAGGVWELGRMKDSSGHLQLGRLNSCMMQAMDELIKKYQPSMVVFETPIMKAQTTDRMLKYLAGAVETACYENGRIPVFEAAAPTARKAVLGFARQQGKDIKVAVMAWCKAQGLAYADNNHADALLLWTYAGKVLRERAAKPEALLF